MIYFVRAQVADFNPDRNRRRDSGNTYFPDIVPIYLIKIGHTRCKAIKRLTGIRNQVNKPITLLAWISGDRRDEQQLHHRFHHLRLGSHKGYHTRLPEWFYPGADLVGFIREAQSQMSKIDGSDERSAFDHW